MFDDLCEQLHTTAVEKGFWPEDVDDIFITKQLMMIVSEAVEVMEAIRKDKGEEEIADESTEKGPEQNCIDCSKRSCFLTTFARKCHIQETNNHKAGK